MKQLRRNIAILTLSSLLLSGCAFGGSRRLGRDEALQLALKDAGLTKEQVVDIDIELERGLGSAWYEIDFESGRTEYEYKIDATSGAILSSRTD